MHTSHPVYRLVVRVALGKTKQLLADLTNNYSPVRYPDRLGLGGEATCPPLQGKIMKLVHTITSDDIDKRYLDIVLCEHCGTTERFDVQDFIGRVMKLDVGKRIYLSDTGQLHVENQEQLEKRLGHIS